LKIKMKQMLKRMSEPVEIGANRVESSSCSSSTSSGTESSSMDDEEKESSSDYN